MKNAHCDKHHKCHRQRFQATSGASSKVIQQERPPGGVFRRADRHPQSVLNALDPCDEQPVKKKGDQERGCSYMQDLHHRENSDPGKQDPHYEQGSYQTSNSLV